jgi:hypothetical protein
MGAHVNSGRMFPRCGGCGQRIQFVTGGGRYSDWMHAEARSELGEDGHLATPEGLEVRYVEQDA